MVARSVRATWSVTPASSPRGVFGVISDLLSSARGAGGRRVFHQPAIETNQPQNDKHWDEGQFANFHLGIYP